MICFNFFFFLVFVFGLMKKWRGGLAWSEDREGEGEEAPASHGATAMTRRGSVSDSSLRLELRRGACVQRERKRADREVWSCLREQAEADGKKSYICNTKRIYLSGGVVFCGEGAGEGEEGHERG